MATIFRADFCRALTKYNVDSSQGIFGVEDHVIRTLEDTKRRISLVRCQIVAEVRPEDGSHLLFDQSLLIKVRDCIQMHESGNSVTSIVAKVSQRPIHIAEQTISSPNGFFCMFPILGGSISGFCLNVGNDFWSEVVNI